MVFCFLSTVIPLALHKGVVFYLEQPYVFGEMNKFGQEEGQNVIKLLKEKTTKLVEKVRNTCREYVCGLYTVSCVVLVICNQCAGEG